MTPIAFNHNHRGRNNTLFGRFVELLSAFVVLAWASAALCATAQTEVEVAAETLFRAAKRFILVELGDSKTHRPGTITLEDRSAGFIRFIYREGKYEEREALLEVIEQDTVHSKLRLTLPSDYAGRAQVLMSRLSDSLKRVQDESKGVSFQHSAQKVYRSALRFVLKSQVTTGLRREDVIRVAEEEAGVIVFVYRDRNFSEPEASIEVFPVGDRASRAVVLIPSDTTLRQPLLEKEFARVVKDDLGDSAAGTGK